MKLKLDVTFYTHLEMKFAFVRPYVISHFSSEEEIQNLRLTLKGVDRASKVWCHS